MKALLLGGGKGTRLKPLTDHQNKHEIVVGGKPLLEHALTYITQSGIQEIIINYNETYSSEEFVPLLADKYQKIYPNIKFAYRKTQSRGLAGEILQSSDLLIGSSYAIVMGDVLFEKPQQFKKYVQDYEKGGYDSMMLIGEAKNPRQHATPIYDNEKIVGIIEKCENPPHNKVVTTWDIFSETSLNYINELTPSPRNELELTDLRNLIIKRQFVGYSFIDGWWLDAGTFEGLELAKELMER